MKRVAVLGAGNGGLATAAELALGGNEVRLFNRSNEPIEAVRRRGGIRLRGALGQRVAVIATATTDIQTALEGANVAVVVLPALAHGSVASALARTAPRVPVVLNPGHMCGSLHLRRVFEEAGVNPPRIAELGTLTSVCRSHAPGSVDVYMLTERVPLAVVADGANELLSEAVALFPRARVVESPIEAWLSDVNMVLHPPGMILGASRIETSDEGFLFYRDGITPSVEAVLTALDEERRVVGKAYDVDLPNLAETMASLGTADAAAAERGAPGDAIREGEANATIKAPSSTDHRYLHEDIPYGLVPLAALARCAGIDTPVATAMIALASVINNSNYEQTGLNARRLGIEGLDAPSVQELAAGRT